MHRGSPQRSGGGAGHDGAGGHGSGVGAGDHGSQADVTSHTHVEVGLNTTMASVHTDVDFPFRFQTPYRPVNWRAVSGADLAQIRRDGDVEQLMSHAQDVMYGDCSSRDVVADGRLKRTLLLAQYTTQYLNYCKETYQESCEGLQATVREREEALRAATADYEKQRARKVALKREKKQLDEEIALYFSLIRKVNPGLYARLRVLKDGSLAVAPALDAGVAALPKPRVSRRRRAKSPRKPVQPAVARAKGVEVATSPIVPTPRPVVEPPPATPEAGDGATSNVFFKPQLHRAASPTMPERRTLLRPTGMPPPGAESHPPPPTAPVGAPSAQELGIMRTLEGELGSPTTRLRHATLGSPRTSPR